MVGLRGSLRFPVHNLLPSLGDASQQQSLPALTLLLSTPLRLPACRCCLARWQRYGSCRQPGTREAAAADPLESSSVCTYRTATVLCNGQGWAWLLVADRQRGDCQLQQGTGEQPALRNVKLHRTQGHRSNLLGYKRHTHNIVAAADSHTTGLHACAGPTLWGGLCPAHTCRRDLSSQNSCTEHTIQENTGIFSGRGTLQIGVHTFLLAKPRKPLKGVTLAHCGATPHTPAAHDTQRISTDSHANPMQLEPHRCALAGNRSHRQ